MREELTFNCKLFSDDLELQAIEVCMTVLSTLDTVSGKRVLVYVADRYLEGSE